MNVINNIKKITAFAHSFNLKNAIQPTFKQGTNTYKKCAFKFRCIASFVIKWSSRVNPLTVQFIQFHNRELDIKSMNFCWALRIAV